MELRIGQKGRVAPPPTLDDPFQRVSEAIASWNCVTALTHWHLSRRGKVDGSDFYVANRELGHIHLNGEVHLATDKRLHAKFVGDGRAEPFPFGGTYATWTLFRIRSESDAKYAISLFRQNYERLLDEVP